jgi:hypothetical protein
VASGARGVVNCESGSTNTDSITSIVTPKSSEIPVIICDTDGEVGNFEYFTFLISSLTFIKEYSVVRNVAKVLYYGMDISQHVIDISKQKFGRIPDQAIATTPVGPRTFMTVTIDTQRYLYVFCTKEQCETDIFFNDMLKAQGIVTPEIIYSGLLLDAGWYILQDLPRLQESERLSRVQEISQLLQKIYSTTLKGAGFISGNKEFYTTTHDSVASFLRDLLLHVGKESLWTQNIENSAKQLKNVLIHGNLGADVWHVYRDKVCLLFPGPVVAASPELDYASYLSVHSDIQNLYKGIQINPDIVNVYKELGV